MTEYISRDAAIVAVTRAKLPDTTPDGVPIANGKRSVTDCVRRIKNIPAADVRPVVLCRDCKHRFMTPNGWHCPYAEWGIEDDDFCSCGEKREEN